MKYTYKKFEKAFTLRTTSGFTLIELLLSIGIIAILAGIVITAINPSKQFANSEDAKRTSMVKELQNAVYQYTIDNSAIPAGIPTGESNAMPICGEGITGDSSCLSLDMLIEDGKYMTGLPQDSAEDVANYLGYEIYKSQGGFVVVTARNLGKTGGSSTELVACTSGGAGTLLDPITVCTCTELQDLESSLTSYHQLGRNIDCSETVSWNSGAGFDPIGISSAAFAGTLNGQGYTVSNLFINRPTEDYVGLFGYVDRFDDAVFVTDSIGLLNVDITGKDNVGGLMGFGTSFDTMNKSYTSGNITGVNYVGGLAGKSLVPISQIIIRNSYSTANVSGTSNIGGLMGMNSSCGGFLGCIGGGEMDDSYFAGTVSGTATYVGGTVGRHEVTNHNTFYDSDTVTCTGCDNITNAETSANLTSEAYLTSQGWDFASVWEIAGSYPTHQ